MKDGLLGLRLGATIMIFCAAYVLVSGWFLAAWTLIISIPVQLLAVALFVQVWTED